MYSTSKISLFLILLVLVIGISGATQYLTNTDTNFQYGSCDNTVFCLANITGVYIQGNHSGYYNDSGMLGWWRLNGSTIDSSAGNDLQGQVGTPDSIRNRYYSFDGNSETFNFKEHYCLGEGIKNENVDD